MKYTNKLKITRSLSFLLVVLLLLVQIPFSAMALEIEDENLTATLPNTEGQDNRSAGASSLLGIGEKSYAELQTLRVEDVVRPEVVTLAMAQEKGHVNRLTAQEQTLNSVMFQNLDGSKTAYVFSAPVKYVTANGDVRDKSTALTAQNGSAFAYAMTDNSVNVYFGAKLSWGGVKTVYDGNSVTLKPVTTANPSPTLGADGKSVTYAGAFGNGTALQYRTLLNGVKEDIVLNSNVGQSSFAFNMTLDGFTPELRDGVWCLLDDRDVAVLSLGRVLVKDSANNEALGTMNVTANKLGGYTVTVTAPEDFLNDENTVYPVYVDPNMVVNENEYYTVVENGTTVHHPYNAIVDTGLYNDETLYRDAYASMGVNHWIYPNEGKLIIKLSDFYEEYGLFRSLYADQIHQVVLHVTAGYEIYNSTFVVNPMAVRTNEGYPILDASQDGDLWNAYASAPQTQYNVNASINSVILLDITQLAKTWANYNMGKTGTYHDPQCGLVLSNTTATYASIYSTNSALYETYMFYQIDYSDMHGTYYMENKTAPNTYLSGINPMYCSTTYDSFSSGWDFIYVEDNKYVISSSYASGYIFSDLGYIDESPSYPLSDRYYWNLLFTSDGGAIIRNCETGKVLCYDGINVTMVDLRSSSASNYNQTVWYLKHVYGGRSFWILDEDKYDDVNCLGYAMMRESWDTAGMINEGSWDDIISAMDPGHVLGQSYPQMVLDELAYTAHIDFTYWLNGASMEYSEYYTYDSSFSGNGDETPLNENQYRVVLRIGVQDVLGGDNNYHRLYGFHFWYQTSDGRWAHKAGQSIPKLLPYGVTPFDINSYGGWSFSGVAEFYNSPIYCYIITMH